MIGVYGNINLSHSQQSPWAMDAANDLPTSTQAEEFQLALKDAKRTMAEDPLLKHPGVVGLPNDDFTSRLNFRSDAWEELKLQALSSELVVKVAATSPDDHH